MFREQRDLKKEKKEWLLLAPGQGYVRMDTCCRGLCLGSLQAAPVLGRLG